MKKIAALFVLGCIVSASAFSQLSVGGYTKSYWIPYRLTVFQDTDMKDGEILQTTAVQTPWGEPDLSAGVNFDAHSEWGGFHLGIGLANGAANRSAHAFSATGGGWVWVRPLGFIPALGMETFTIWLGNPDNSQLMGKIGGSDLATYVLNNSYSIDRNLQENGYVSENKERLFRLEKQNPEYNTFTRFNPYAWGNANAETQNLWWPRIAAAAKATWEPIERLYIGFFVAPEMLRLLDWNADSAGVNNPILESINGDKMSDDDINQDFFDVAKVYRKMQIGAGYTIPGIGFARAQFIGLRNVVEVAFQLTALGDLVFDFGFKLPFEGTDKEDTFSYKKKRDFGASVAATYRNYDFHFLGRIDAAFAGSDSSRPGREARVGGLNMIVYLVPSYKLNVGTVGLDLGFEYEQKDDFNRLENDSVQAGAGVWFHRNLGNAQFKAGVAARLPLEWDGNKQPFDLFIPLVLSVSF
ncbi:MAG: hypothetical protein LBI06_05010 [Treponema sp.]|jgi:hypothetical protein|nr:hypothetical protein [Treponema sp.]